MTQLFNGHHTLSTTMSKAKDSVVSRFYDDRSIFMTGATGFVGKIVLEKLLRSCPGIRNIYILMRDKKGKSSKQRCEELLNSEIFDLVKSEYPEAIKKVIALNGDVTLPVLGLSESDMVTIIQNVSIVFHSAAIVKFDEPLKQAVEINVLGTRRILQLCHEIKRIEALIHVSTAYSNCNRSEIEEVIYPPPISYREIMELTKLLKPDVPDVVTSKILAISNRPNTYTLTKALAEHIIAEEHGSLPVAVIRPSIVSAVWKEPFPGWTDNLNGPSGIIVASGKGFLRTMIAHAEVIADIIPVDIVANLVITAAWRTAVSRMVKRYQKIHKAVDCLEFFTTNEWKFHCDNILKLNDMLSEEDHQKFYGDISSLNWNSFWKNHVLGVRKYMLKEDPSSIPAARRNLKRRYIFCSVAQVLLVIIVWVVFFPDVLPLN